MKKFIFKVKITASRVEELEKIEHSFLIESKNPKEAGQEFYRQLKEEIEERGLEGIVGDY